MSGRVFVDISMSLNGFMTGPNDSVEAPLGEGGDRLHQWVYDLASWRRPHGLEGGRTGADDDLMNEAFERMGAVVMGRRMFDLAEEPWGDDPPFHAQAFVLTHRAREPLVKEGGTTFTFVTDGIERALELAKAAAGGKNVSIAGGANAIQQYLNAGLLDEMQIHIVPVLLGDGRRLFEDLGTEPIELEGTRVIDSKDVTHVRFRPPKTPRKDGGAP
jgi:dihydrofolate reductase